MASDATEEDPLLPNDPNTILNAAAIEDLIDAKLDPNGKVDWRHEINLILSASAQLAGTYLLQYFYNLIIIWVVSHLGRDELAAVSIGITTMNICGFAIFEGFATALDTLCSQGYGSGNLKHVGLHVQRMVIFLLLVAVPIGAVWIASPWILYRLIPQPQLAAPAGAFLRITLLGVPGYATFEAGKRFLQAQNDFTASLAVLIACAPLSILLNWLLVFRLGWGVAGAALAAALINDLRAVLLVLYVIFITPSALECWQPLSRTVFNDWGPMVRLSIPGAVMTFCEWAPFEILTFSTSFLGTAELAAQTLLATVAVLIWHIPFSAGVAVSTRIGHMIGAGALQIARQLTKLYTPLFLCLGLIEMAVLLFFRRPIASIFTQDAEVRALVENTMVFVALFVIFDSTTCACHAILRGLGRQAYGGWVAFIVNFYTVPLAIYLELGTSQLGLSGVWIATGSCLVIVTSVEIVIMSAMDWQKCVDEAREREMVHQ